MSARTASGLPAIEGGRPPVEFRRFGLDRRTFALPLIVVAVFVLWAVIAPAVNNAVGYDDPVRAGDAFVIGPATTIAPPVGWGVQAGVRTSDGTRAPVATGARIAIVGDGVTITSQVGPFAGTARELVKQVADNDAKISADSAFTVEGKPRTLSVDGRRGVAQEFKLPTGEGAVFGFVTQGQGISIVVTGQENALDHAAVKLGQMIASIDFDVQGIA